MGAVLAHNFRAARGQQSRLGNYFPVPDSDTVCVPDAALSVTFNVADREPLAAGLNATLIVQLLPAASELPQFELGVKSDALVPVTARLIGVSAVVPVFLSVTVLVALRFTVCVPKLRLVALRLA